MTKARLAWRVVGKLIPESLRALDDHTITCEVDLPDEDVLVVDHGGYRLLVNHNAQTTTLNDTEIDLAPIPFKVLIELARQPKKFCSAADLYRDVWGGDLSRVSTRSVDAAVGVIRKQLPDGWVYCKPGKGWRLIP